MEPGVPETFEGEFDHLWKRAFNVGWRFFHNDRARAEDVAQETLSRVLVRWWRVGRFDQTHRQRWVIRTATNVCLEMHRRVQRETPTDAIDTTPASPATGVLDARMLTPLLARLSTRQRDVVVARYYFDYSVEETASLLGLTVSKVKDAAHEAATKLRRQAGHLAPDLLGGDP